MTRELKQSTAATIKFGPLVDDTDGKTPETALTISQADIRLSKNGGDFAQTHNSAGATHDENGYYDIPLDTTDTDTLGSLEVAVYESGALIRKEYFEVVTANYRDTKYGNDKFTVDVEEIRQELDTNSTKLANLDAAISSIQAGSGPTVEEINAKLVEEHGDGIWGRDLEGKTTYEYTVTNENTGLPIADCLVWVTSDASGLNKIDAQRTNQNGKVTFYLDAGTVYIWRNKNGISFVNPDIEVVS